MLEEAVSLFDCYILEVLANSYAGPWVYPEFVVILSVLFDASSVFAMFSGLAILTTTGYSSGNSISKSIVILSSRAILTGVLYSEISMSSKSTVIL